jgi:hypothetical protein
VGERNSAKTWKRAELDAPHERGDSDDGRGRTVVPAFNVVAVATTHQLGCDRAAGAQRAVVGMAATPSGMGTWRVRVRRRRLHIGRRALLRLDRAMHLNQPIVGITGTPTGRGYWFVASDGGVFTFGNARFHGSTGSMHLNQPIVGITSTRSGRGYWLIARDGGVFSFGDAKFYGSTARCA